MEKHPNPFDDFIKEAMKGHGLTPSGKARKAFLDEASGVIPTRKPWKNWYLMPVIMVFLGGLVAFFVFINEDSSLEAVVSHESPVINRQEPGATPQEPVINNQSPVTNPQEPTVTPQEPVTHNQSPITSHQSPVTNTQEPTVAPQEPVTNNQSPITNNQSPVTSTQEPTVAPQEPVTNNQSPITNNQSPATNTQEPTVAPQEPVTNNQSPITSNQSPVTDLQEPTPWRFAVSGYYLPELMFNTLEGNKYVNNFGMEAIFYRGLISIRTGAGLSISKGITENEVNYNDYLGTYNKLDSITFTYNEELNNFEQEIYTSSEKAWDSTEQSDSTEIVKRYTYLQVPLVLGFDFWQRGKISIGVRVGTIMSAMLKSQQLTGEYDPGENQVVGVDQLTPSQVSINWQAIGAFDVSVALSERIGLELEPQAKYYYGSIYEESGDVKKPWSLGVRVAFVYKFY